LSARRIEVDEASAKAAMYGLNCLVRRMHELEEAWIAGTHRRWVGVGAGRRLVAVASGSVAGAP
jgi:hypothetical protein